MKIAEIIRERGEGPVGSNLVTNPSSNWIMKQLETAPDHTLKGLYDKKTHTLYVWVAYFAYHHHIEYELGLDHADQVPLVISLYNNLVQIITIHGDDPIVQQHPSWRGLNPVFNGPDWNKSELSRRWV